MADAVKLIVKTGSGLRPQWASNAATEKSGESTLEGGCSLNPGSLLEFSTKSTLESCRSATVIDSHKGDGGEG